MKKAKDTLIIVGNGFDIWQDLHTSYSDFQKYYLAHRDEIMRKLRIKKKVVKYEDGSTVSISDVELIYGDPFHPQELEAEFWGTFETSLDKLDAERINLFFGKERKGLREMNKSIRNAGKILREAFCNWIATITIEQKDTDYHFDDNCIFINFNYTDTLLKRFQVKKEDEFHIHGEASDKESIIVGHSTHPQLPEEFLYRMGGRFRGLYFVEKILYETDKHVQDNIIILCMFLAMHGVMVENIKNIYVLGHSMSLPDIEYFAFLADATRVHHEEEESDIEDSEEYDPLEELHNRLQYAINRSGYGLEDERVTEEQRVAVGRRFEAEQLERTRELERDFFKLQRKSKRRADSGTAAEDVKPRTEDAAWHITYYSEKDKVWAANIMKAFGCENFKLYPTIDECLEIFK